MAGLQQEQRLVRRPLRQAQELCPYFQRRPVLGTGSMADTQPPERGKELGDLFIPCIPAKRQHPGVGLCHFRGHETSGHHHRVAPSQLQRQLSPCSFGRIGLRLEQGQAFAQEGDRFGVGIDPHGPLASQEHIVDRL